MNIEIVSIIGICSIIVLLFRKRRPLNENTVLEEEKLPLENIDMPYKIINDKKTINKNNSNKNNTNVNVILKKLTNIPKY